MEASWVVLKTSVPPACALLGERWSLFTISQNSLPIFCFTQFKWWFYPFNIFHIIWTLVCSPVWITTLLFPCCFGLHKCSQNESYKGKSFFIDHSIYKNISFHMFLCFLDRVFSPDHFCKKRIRTEKDSFWRITFTSCWKVVWTLLYQSCRRHPVEIFWHIFIFGGKI